jgi:superfamily II DNA/RNA helicase
MSNANLDKQKSYENVIIESFDDLKLSENLLRGIYAYNWEKPSKVQQIGIKPVIDGNDSVIQAQSGTGKTGTFSIAALQMINPNIKSCQCVILSPTREIADQTYKVITNLGHYMTNVSVCGVIGGKRLRNDVVNRSQIIIGTPGRVADMIRRNVLNMKTLTMFILDEADQMLDIGFKDQILDIYEYTPKNSQIAIYSATMKPAILELSNKLMTNPVKLLIKKEEITLEGIRQFYIEVESELNKFEVMSELYHTLTIAQSMIYCSTKRKVEWLTEKLEESGFPISKIHGDMTQETRDKIMTQFREGKTRILITTDLLARGIDIEHVCLVINYDLPNNRENYIHRIGRTGRYGRKGVAINLVLTDQDTRKIKEIEKYYQTIIEEMPNNIQQYIT